MFFYLFPFFGSSVQHLNPFSLRIKLQSLLEAPYADRSDSYVKPKYSRETKFSCLKRTRVTPAFYSSSFWISSDSRGCHWLAEIQAWGINRRKRFSPEDLTLEKKGFTNGWAKVVRTKSRERELWDAKKMYVHKSRHYMVLCIARLKLGMLPQVTASLMTYNDVQAIWK